MFRAQRYISDELTHFVGRSKREDLEAQYTVLLRILREGWLTHYPHNPNVSGNLAVNLDAKISQNEMYVPQMVCFCDIPAEDLGLHASKYGCFGLAFKKTFLAGKGANPVYYVTRGSVITVMRDLTRIDWTLLKPDQLTMEVSRGDYFDEMVRTFHSVSQEHSRRQPASREEQELIG